MQDIKSLPHSLRDTGAININRATTTSMLLLHIMLLGPDSTKINLLDCLLHKLKSEFFNVSLNLIAFLLTTLLLRRKRY